MKCQNCSIQLDLYTGKKITFPVFFHAGNSNGNMSWDFQQETQPGNLRYHEEINEISKRRFPAGNPVRKDQYSL